jgi:O-antigen ligase
MNKLTFSAKGLDLLKQTVVILTVFIFLFALGFTHSLIQYRILIFFAGILTFLGIIWLVEEKKSPIPLKPFLLLWLTAYSISVILSIDPRRSLSQMFLMLVGVFLFLLAHDLVSRGWKITWFMQSFILVGTVLVLINLSEVLSWYLKWISNNPGIWIPSITYRPGTTNLMAPFMYLTFHMGLPFLIKPGRKIIKFGLGIIIFLALVVLYLTSSRGGWLGLFFGLIIWGVYFMTTAREKLKSWVRKLFSNKLVFATVTMMLIVIITIGGILLYKQAVHPTHGNIFTSRAGLWGPAITAFKENPVFGQGPFTYGSSFLNENSAPPINVYAHAHGLYHNLLAEMGIVGFLAAALFAIFYFRTFKTQFAKSTQKILHLGIFAFMVSCAVHNIFDAFHLEPALLWPFAILAGAAIANPAFGIQKNTSNRPWWVLLLISFAWFGIWTITPYYQAVELANSNQWQPAYEKFQQAVERDPGNGLAHQQLGLSAAVLAQQGQQELLDVAIPALQTTIQHEPSWALNHANLSSLYFSNYDLQNGIIHSKQAIKLAPNSSLFKITVNPTWDRTNISETYSVTSSIRGRLSIEEFINNKEYQNLLEKFHQYSWSYNVQAKIFLVKNDLESAKKSLQNSELVHSSSKNDSIETIWLWAEYYAKKGEYEKAIQKGNYAINEYSNYGIFGPGTFGILQYAPRIFRMNAMAMEIIPQMIDVPIPEIWIERSKQVKIWESEFQER